MTTQKGRRLMYRPGMGYCGACWPELQAAWTSGVAKAHIQYIQAYSIVQSQNAQSPSATLLQTPVTSLRSTCGSAPVSYDFLPLQKSEFSSFISSKTCPKWPSASRATEWLTSLGLLLFCAPHIYPCPVPTPSILLAPQLSEDLQSPTSHGSKQSSLIKNKCPHIWFV
jgi:hypothetical protein